MMLWAPKSEGLGLSVRAISFQDFQPTDRQTGGKFAIAIPRFALKCIAQKRGKNFVQSLDTPIMVTQGD